MKSLWRFICTESVWSKICWNKYIRFVDKFTWLWKGYKSWGNPSPVWRSLIETRQWILPGLSWEIGSGKMADIRGFLSGQYKQDYLSPQLVEYLRIKGYEKLEHIYFKPFSLPGDWRDSTFFRFNGDWKILWDKFIGTLKRLGI